MPPSFTPPEPAGRTNRRSGRSMPPGSIPQPARPRHATLPHALTFFLTTAQRRAVLAALRRHHPTREPALLRALDIPPDAMSKSRSPGCRT